MNAQAHYHLINRTVYYRGQSYTLVNVPNKYLYDVYELRSVDEVVKLSPLEFEIEVKYDK